ncbi:MAG: dinitrogenase iron-molybdenum cofactor biosynthesis protein [Candidatus Neomarinimicrobiota bacterium]|nr:MAG: dinitrogenase iron-molybdenum cofactor biosynthesis protein [Candidatus Neomarinimicrobiota bacterium]
MDEMMVAVATDTGRQFIDRHFGDAKYFDIYTITKNSVLFIKRIENTVDEQEDVHADPEKAKGVAGLLKQEDVHVVVSKIFGPNIKRIKKKFVCVVMNDKSIKSALERLSQNWDMIIKEWEKGADRNHCILRKSL